MTDDMPTLEAMRAQIRATPLPADARTPRPWRRPGWLAFVSGGALALVAVVVAVVLLVTAGSGAPPAYAAALHTSSSGQRTITITLQQERDIPQLNALLAAKHTRIRVVPVVRGCDAPVHEVSNGKVIPGPAKTMLAVAQYHDGKLLTLEAETIEVNTIAGRTLVVPDSPSGMYSGGGGVVVGPAPSCLGIGPRFIVKMFR